MPKPLPVLLALVLLTLPIAGSATDPTVGEPASAEPSSGEPSSGEPSSAEPSSAATPTGAAVYDRFVRASGGADAIARVDAFHVHGTYALPAAGLEGTIDLHYDRGKLRFVVDLPGFGTVRTGFDGETAWKIDPQAGARILEGAERDGVLGWVARAFSVLPRPGAVEALGTAERVTFEGHDAWKVRLRIASTGHTYDDHFDPETGLLRGRIETPAALGGAELRATVDAHRTFHGLRIPSTWTHQAAGQTWTATYTAMDLGPIDPTVFALPPEIRALQPTADGG